eukprot:GFUD01025348.1.p1 GENE.GFUD01025348.1~~GFUD01025348.1.p1  ORF type:complete len:1584 (+),score=477.54 GFUD01025348.1:160-4911(+)
MDGGRISRVASCQDGSQFEDSLRRLHALEKKLTDQVHIDIAELRQKWVQQRVDRVTNHTFKLYQVREHLKLSKVLYVEEDQILDEFNNVKGSLVANSMDDETFEAARKTCLVLGGKLGDIRNKQTRCYSDTTDLELVINKDIMTLKFEDKDFEDLDINQVRASTPVRQLSPTPLERHRSRSREPSEFRIPTMKLSTGTITPGGSIPPDPHAYFSRPNSSQSMYGGRGGGEMDAFRTAMEAKQAKDCSPVTEIQNHQTSLSNSLSGNIVMRSASGQIITKSDESDILLPGGAFVSERPGSAMSDMSIDIENLSRPGSMLEFLGDEISGKIDPYLSEMLNQEQEEIEKKLNQEQEEIEKNMIARKAVEEEAHKQVQDQEEIRKNKEAKKKKEEEEKKEEDRKRQIEEANNSKLNQEQEELEKNKIARKAVEEEAHKQVQDQEEIRKNKEAKKKKEEEDKKEEDRKRKIERSLIEQEGKRKEQELEDKAEQIRQDDMDKEKELVMLEKEEKKCKLEEKPKDIKTKEEVESLEKEQISNSGTNVLNSDEVEITNSPLSNSGTKVLNTDKVEIIDSPLSIMKGGKESRDNSNDRNKSEGITCDQGFFSNPLSKSGSLTKSGSLGKRCEFSEKKKISFDDDIDLDKCETDSETISAAKEIFAEIADASMEAGIRVSKSRDASKERRSSKVSLPEFTQEEPAEWNPSEFDNEDELMIILDDEEPELLALGTVKSRSQSKDRQRYINSASLTKTGVKKSRSASGVPELEVVEQSSLLRQIMDDMQDIDTVNDKQITSPRQHSQNRHSSTGFSHLDEFERKLAEMEQELANEEALRSTSETIEDGSLRRAENSWDLSPKVCRATITDNELKENEDDYTHAMTPTRREQIIKEGVQIIKEGVQNIKEGVHVCTNQEEEHPIFDPSLKNMNESSNETEDNFVVEYIVDEITGQSIKRYKKVSFAEVEGQTTGMSPKFSFGNTSPLKNIPGTDGMPNGFSMENLNKENVETDIMSKRSRSKEPTPKSFLSAMTGGLIESNGNESSSVFGSLLQIGRKSSRSRSRHTSRNSSRDRASQEPGSEDEGSRRGLDNYDSASDVGSENSIVLKLKKLTKKKPKVQAADFDELFARGMAMSDKVVESENINNQEESFKIAIKQDIGYNEKVLSYLDDQGQAQSSRSNVDLVQGHVSRERGRKKYKQQPLIQTPVSVQPEDRSVSTQDRKRSREYAKPEEIKLSPLPKRDLFTGKLVPESPAALFLQRVTDFVNQNQTEYQTKQKAILNSEYEDTIENTLKPSHYKPEKNSPLPVPRPPHDLTPSPGKSFLNATNGQEVFGASIEGEFIKSEPTNLKEDEISDAQALNPTTTVKYSPPRHDEPADKGIPAQLLPDKLLANEEFYENLRSESRSGFQQTQDDSESYQKYSQHLGRAEFGTLKKRTSNQASRDTSAERFKQNVVSRDPSLETIHRKLNSNGKLSRQSSKDQIRSDSRMSDYSGELPDLEVKDDIKTTVEEASDSNHQIQRTQSLVFDMEQVDKLVIVDSTAEVLVKRGEVLKEIEEHKQQVKDTKAWIQNGLMTVVGFGVMAYLQTLEAVAGGQ